MSKSVFVYGVASTYDIQAELDCPQSSLNALLEQAAEPHIAHIALVHSTERVQRLFEETLDSFLVGCDPDEDDFLDADDFVCTSAWSLARSDENKPYIQQWVYSFTHNTRPHYESNPDFMVVVQERTINTI